MNSAIVGDLLGRLRLPFLVGWIAFASLLPAAALDQAEIRVGGGLVTVSFDGQPPEKLRDLILAWITTAARAVTAYYHQFPVPAVTVEVELTPGQGIGSGRAFGSGQPRIEISVGKQTSAGDFAEDWMITHEMVHLAFPDVAEEHHWIEEGLAVYVEPIARARIGTLSAERVWGDMFRDMPQGMPRAGDRGLDYTHTWARTYWGGALFCLMADIEIRRQTANQQGLEDAVRGILQHGGSIRSEWPLARALQVADRAVGLRVLEQMYDQLRASPGNIDLLKLWRELGIVRRGGQVILDDAAPLAPIRKAITREQNAVAP